MDERRFIYKDQERFARLSGDFNPMHMDPVFARRTMLGDVVVHGIHSLLWAMDSWCKSQKELLQLICLKVEFSQAVTLGEKVSITILNEECDCIEFMLHSKTNTVFIANMRVISRLDDAFVKVNEEEFSTGSCQTIVPSELVGIKQNISLTCNRGLASELFPHLMRVFPLDQIALLLSTTRLVGMRCPGMYSVYSSVDLKLKETNKVGVDVKYVVERFDSRFSMLKIKLMSPSVDGLVTAFYRPPQEQASYLALSAVVEKNAFQGQKALVVGGARGIGETCAKLLAAGGADVVLSYNRGEADGIRVVDEINRGNGSAHLIKLDVLNIADDLIHQLPDEWEPTHIYFFATPPIFVAQRNNFSYDLFRTFCDYYLGGLLNLMNALDALGAKSKHLLYPSTVAIDELPLNMGEYIAAKAAGEYLVRFLEKVNPELRVHTPRLPRISTDQTPSIVPTRNEDAGVLVLPILQDMAATDIEISRGNAAND
jgi:NADP-dependent 3-hydroxy acid dehydrogenase YdfG